MKICNRLKTAREALGLSQQDMADAGGVSLRSQQNYEAGLRSPDSDYLAAIAAAGADVLHILTGQRSASASATKPDEAALLKKYRAAPQSGKDALQKTGAALAQSELGAGKKAIKQSA